MSNVVKMVISFSQNTSNKIGLKIRHPESGNIKSVLCNVFCSTYGKEDTTWEIILKPKKKTTHLESIET